MADDEYLKCALSGVANLAVDGVLVVSFVDVVGVVAGVDIVVVVVVVVVGKMISSI